MFTVWKIQVCLNVTWNMIIDYLPFNHLFSFFSYTKDMTLFNLIQSHLFCMFCWLFKEKMMQGKHNQIRTFLAAKTQLNKS